TEPVTTPSSESASTAPAQCVSAATSCSRPTIVSGCETKAQYPEYCNKDSEKKIICTFRTDQSLLICSANRIGNIE
ncbi:hypothetical protein, partial [Nitrosomonas sp. ANs5]|uniref:hypothetical protein n=1 Tax=Nitrosomonas sp. ANs5 TaxID=3423941 RepID=UPI003D33466C